MNAIASVLLVLLAQVASPPAADPQSKAAAQALLKEGTALYERGEFTEALAKFEAAYATYASPKLQFNIAQADRDLGRPVEALEAFEKFLALAPDAAPEILEEARRSVTQLAAGLGQIKIECSTPGSDMTFDGKLIGTTPLSSPIWATPGNHQIVIRHEQYIAAIVDVTASAGEKRTVTAHLRPLLGSPTSPQAVELVQGPNERRVARRATEAEPAPQESSNPNWYFGIGIGSGFGWTTGSGEVNSQDRISSPSFEPANLGQLTPEGGYFLSRQLLLSLQLRLQRVTGATPFYASDASCGPSGVCSPAPAAYAGLVRIRWLLGDDKVHPFAGAVAGLGTIRHVTTFSTVPHDCGSNQTSVCVDTIASGPVFLGGTAGILYNLTPMFALTAETNIVAGFTRFTFNFDGNVGVAVEF